MVQLFWRSFCRQIRRNGSVSLVLLIGMVVSALCISIMLGSAQGQYRLVAGYSEYATLTINLSESGSEEGKKIAEMLPDTFGDSIANVLYLTVSGEDILYIGWQGYQQERWFPHTAGRFFSSGEQARGDNVVYLSDSLYQTMAGQDTLSINGTPYQVIGAGWIAPYNIWKGISSLSPVSCIPENMTAAESTILVFPYRNFLEHLTPTQVLVHFDSASMAQLQDYRQAILAQFPEVSIYLPGNDSGVVLSQEQWIRGVLGIILSLIAGITILQLMREWVVFFRKELYVYHLCGLSKGKCLCLIYGQWLLYYLLGAAIAVAIHRVMFPLLSPFYANYLPSAGSYLVVLLALLVLTVASSLRAVKASMDMTKGGRMV